MNKGLDYLFGITAGDRDGDAPGVISLARQWAAKEVIGNRLDYQRNYAALFEDKARVLALNMGLQRLAVPEDQGGFGWQGPNHAADRAAVLSEVGRADSSTGILLALNYVLFSVLTRFSEGRAGFVEAVATSYLEDELKIASCILPGPGSVGEETPLFKGRSILARVKAHESGFVISGADLRPFAAGLKADLLLVVCADERGRPCIAVVPGDAPGVERGRGLLTTGLNALANADISFVEAEIKQENLIQEPEAIPLLFTLLNLFLGGVSLGAGMNFFEILLDWSDSRIICGATPLKENPLCASVLADAAEEIACSRLLLDGLARLVSPGGNVQSLDAEGLYTYAVMIGARVQQSIMWAINRGMELMGSAGYAKEWHAEKHWRDVKTIQSLLCGVGAEAPAKMDTARFFCDCKEI